MVRVLAPGEHLFRQGDRAGGNLQDRNRAASPEFTVVNLAETHHLALGHRRVILAPSLRPLRSMWFGPLGLLDALMALHGAKEAEGGTVQCSIFGLLARTSAQYEP